MVQNWEKHFDEFRHRFNVRASISHRDSVHDYGIFDHFIIEDIQDLTEYLFKEPSYEDWPSSRHFRDTGEVFGLECSNLGRIMNHDKFDNLTPIEGMSPSLQDLASKSQSCVPFMPVHTPTKKAIFNQAMQDSMELSDLIKVYDDCADGKEVFRKNITHLNLYLSKYSRAKNAKHTVKEFRNLSDLSENLDVNLDQDFDWWTPFLVSSALPLPTCSPPTLLVDSTPMDVQVNPEATEASINDLVIDEELQADVIAPNAVDALVDDLLADAIVPDAADNLADVPNHTIRSKRGKDAAPRKLRRCAVCIHHGKPEADALLCSGRTNRLWCDLYTEQEDEIQAPKRKRRRNNDV